MSTSETKKPTRLKDIAVSTQDMFRLDPRSIVIVPGFNIRDFDLPENKEHVRNLAESIKEIGVKKPLTVRYKDGKAILVDGESRLRATLLALDEGAEIATVPAVVEDRGVNDAERTASLIYNNSGKRPNLLEQAMAFQRLVGFGWTQAMIAKKVGVDPSTVCNALDLAEAPQEVHAMIRAGTVSPSTALKTLKEVGETAVVGVLQSAAEHAVAVAPAGTSTRRRTVTKASVRKAQGKAKPLNETEVDSLVVALREIVSLGGVAAEVAAKALKAVGVEPEEKSAPVIELKAHRAKK